MPRPNASTERDRFADGVAAFLTTLRFDVELPPGFQVLDPYRSTDVRAVVSAFCDRYYAGSNQRVAIWGINPGRYGGGVTGLSFTDPVSLSEQLHIRSSLIGRRELSAEFISMVIDAYGGPKAFYGDFYLSALSPLGFTSGGKNVNFYDHADLARRMVPWILGCMKEQLALGLASDRAIVLGTGKLRDFFERSLRAELPYKDVVYLEHPRFIMQYRRSRISEYVDKYVQTLLRIKR